MGRKTMILLISIVCLGLAGCGTDGKEKPSAETALSSENAAEQEKDASDPEKENEAEESPEPDTGDSGEGEESMKPATEGGFGGSAGLQGNTSSLRIIGRSGAVSGDPVDFFRGGVARITYTVNQNSVRYITSVSELPSYDIEELASYDEEYFREKALVLVTETVGSGTTKPDIQSITRDDTSISVTLSHEAAEIGTNDMATWLIWAEVEQGLDEYEWTLTNLTVRSELQKY